VSRGRKVLVAVGMAGLALLLTACPSNVSDSGGNGDLQECLEENSGVNC
jgi:hypothetical protein